MVFLRTGIALVGASAIAIAPIAPITGPPDIANPNKIVSSANYTLTAFPADLINPLTPLLQQLDPAQLAALLDNLGALVGAAVNPLFDGLALVVDELLDGLTGLVDTLLTDLVPVLQTVFNGLAEVLLFAVTPLVATLLAGLEPIVATVVAGLVVIVGELVPVLLPVTVGLGALLAGLGGLLGGLPLALVGLGAVLGGLFGGLPLAVAAPATAGATTFGATDVQNMSAAQTFSLSTDPVKDPKATLPENASPVAQAATEEGSRGTE